MLHPATGSAPISGEGVVSGVGTADGVADAVEGSGAAVGTGGLARPGQHRGGAGGGRGDEGCGAERSTAGQVGTGMGRWENVPHGSDLSRLEVLLPAEFVESVVVDAEVVGDLVDDGHRDLLDQLLAARAPALQRTFEDEDAIGQDEGPRGVTFG